MPTSPVAQFMQTSYLTQTGTAYPLAIDADIAVASRVVVPFSPYPTSPAGMTVNLAAGALFVAGSLIEVAAQSVTIGAAPTSNSRIDRVVVNELTGAASVIAGTASANPMPPAITAGSFPVAQVTVATGVTAITAAMIADERVPFVGQGSIRANSLTPSKMGFGAWATVASAATVDLGVQTSRNVYIAGTTTISSLGSNGPPDYIPFIVGFTGATTLVNSANLILPGGANITTLAGDMAIIVHDGASVWRVIGYFRTGMPPLIAGTGAGNLLALDASGKIPAVDGSQLTNLSIPGVGQTLSDVTASRAIGTVYQNTTNKMIFVLASTVATGGGSGVAWNLGPTATPGSVGGTVMTNGWGLYSVLPVPPGWYYQMVASNYYIAAWREIR